MDIVDILIYVHPELPADERTKIEETVANCDGVVSVHFSHDHPHVLIVAYDPQAIDSKHILHQVRQWDKEAVMAGL